MTNARRSSGRPMVSTAASLPRLLMPRELFGEPSIDRARGRAVDRVHRDPLLARDPAGSRQRVVTIALESHKDVDTAADDATPGIVREAETVMDLSGRERDSDERGKVEHSPELDASGIDGDRPVWHQPIPGRPDPERRAGDEEIPHGAANSFLDVEDSAVPEPCRALDVQLVPEVQRDSSKHLPLATEQLLGTFSRGPRCLIEDPIKGRDEGTQRCRVRRHVRAVPEPGVVRRTSWAYGCEEGA